jgi:hypothetical protein
MSIFVLPKRGRKAGRKPVNGIDVKAKITVTIDSDIYDLLNNKTNKSKLINDLLRRHYKIPDVSRRLKYVIDLLTEGKFNHLGIPKIASILDFSKAEILESYIDGAEEPDFTFLDKFAGLFGIYSEWLKFGESEPFATPEQNNLYASGYLKRIYELAPKQVLFVRSDDEEGSTGILLQMSDFKFVYMPKTWSISGMGQNQIYDFYRTIKLLEQGERIIDKNRNEQIFLRHKCSGIIISDENFCKHFTGKIFPGSVVED